jgi:hypothetical protein
MANVIKLKRGSGSDPAASDLVVGEIAIRSDTGKLFTKKDNGSVAEISGSGGGASNFFINTLSSSSGSGGGSASFNGTATRFTLSNPPSVAAQQLLVSINGVIQKPNSGTSPSEGFAIDGADIIFASAPVTGAGFFIITYAELAVGVPSDNSVTSAKIADGAIVNGDVSSTAAIAGTKIAPDFGSQNIVTTGTLASGNHTVNGDMTLTGANYNVLWDKSDNALEFADNAIAKFGTGGDLEIFHDSSNSYIKDTGTGRLLIRGSAVSIQSTSGEAMMEGVENGAVTLKYDNSTKFETYTYGVNISGTAKIESGGNFHAHDNVKFIAGTGEDLQIYHEGSNSRIVNSTGNLLLDNSTGVDMYLNSGNDIYIRPQGSENGIKVIGDGAVELYHNAAKKAETVTGGFTITGTCTATAYAGDGSALTGVSAGATGGGSDEVFYENGQTVTTSYSITSNKNAMSAGPLSINSGAVVTIPSGSVWTIV